MEFAGSPRFLLVHWSIGPSQKNRPQRDGLHEFSGPVKICILWCVENMQKCDTLEHHMESYVCIYIYMIYDIWCMYMCICVWIDNVWICVMHMTYLLKQCIYGVIVLCNNVLHSYKFEHNILNMLVVLVYHICLSYHIYIYLYIYICCNIWIYHAIYCWRWILLDRYGISYHIRFSDFLWSCLKLGDTQNGK